ncbi:MAG: cytochrome c-type biogenesis protein CcmH [Alphaproteobacteria bacterium]|nr:cytochrome c-type biogenesis protein CcmH [Alphaproteobacteria bacterium]MDE1985730.1 cytochrome c-type biogenesis protein CcmH [Alphaproteobacteria bacterium]MDE2163421.1 cytochrome c-type biogenesis protein CcmH [Alphaproteobacteria bacterium]MDE2266172.1 cytochrome c-type biogenesis protein CcmH [Alphaproteobacteria bacterium]
MALLATLWGTAGAAWAIRPDEMLTNPKLEARARVIDKQLRCLVCQNESIDDSDADLAHDLRLLVRKRIVAGDTDQQVKQYIVARYGNYVLLKPPFDAETYLLWFGPLVLLLSGAGIAAVYYRRSTQSVGPAELSDEETRRLAALIGNTDGETKGT